MESIMDKIKYYIGLMAIAVLFNGCAPKYLYQTIHLSREIKINNEIAADAKVDSIINPYKMQLDSTMNAVLAYCDTELIKARPSSSLGNFFSDAIRYEAEKKSGGPVDVTLINYGGIRLNALSAGNITLGKVYELMPFDNQVVVLKMSGKVLADVLDYVAMQGGWPVSGVSFTIKKNSAVNIFIGNKAFDITATYTVAVSDYIANGGDNLSMLKLIPQQKIDLLMRDALVDYLKDMQAKGIHINANNTQRIKNVE